MQDFVEKYIEEQKSAIAEKCREAKGGVVEEKEKERDARLIRLGMCEKQYNPTATYSAEYPYQEYKSGKYYRLVPFTVTDEEYAEICRYDDSHFAIKPTAVSEKLLGKSHKGLRRTALFSLFFGALVSILGGVLLYLEESEYLLLSVLIALLGSVFSYLSAVQMFTTAKALEKVDYLLADTEEGK